MKPNQAIMVPSGSSLSALSVKDGQQVSAGEVLLRFANTPSSDQLAPLETELAATRIRRARLDAEVTGADHIEFPESDADTPELAAMVASLRVNEAALFSQHREMLESGREPQDDRLPLQPVRFNPGIWRTGRMISPDTQPATPASLQNSVAEFRASAAAQRFDAILAETRLKQAIATLKQKMRDQPLSAPIDGVVSLPGTYALGAPLNASQPVAEITPLGGPVEASALLNAHAARALQPGNRARLVLPAEDGAAPLALNAHIVDLHEVPDPTGLQNGVGPVSVKLQVDADEWGYRQPIHPGMTARVEFAGRDQSLLGFLLLPVVHR